MIAKVTQERNRYRNTVALAHFGWWSTLGIVALRAIDVIPQALGSLALLTLGAGVAGSLALSRYRLGETIAQTFQAGMKAAITLNANVFTDTCIIALSKKGTVESVDHADAIGWDPRELTGRELRTLLAPRSMGVRKIEPGVSITCPMYNQDGKKFDARISVAGLSSGSGDSAGFEVTRLIATVSPVVSSRGDYELRGSDE